jgi:hypothetical protein
MINLKQVLLFEANTFDNPLDGKSKRNAANWVHGKVGTFARGKFSDEYWQPIQDIFKRFDFLRLDWTPGKTWYDEERIQRRDGPSVSVPVRKTFEFTIKFRNNRDKEDVLYGRMVAAGAGSVEEPLSSYDVTLTVG